MIDTLRDPRLVLLEGTQNLMTDFSHNIQQVAERKAIGTAIQNMLKKASGADPLVSHMMNQREAEQRKLWVFHLLFLPREEYISNKLSLPSQLLLTTPSPPPSLPLQPTDP